MKVNKIFYAGLAILILGIGFAVGTYAYYQTSITGTVGGTVLAWQCTANNQTATFNISLGSLYPGSAVEKTITVGATIAADYTLTFQEYVDMGSGSTHPNLNIYSDSAHSSVINTGGTLNGSVAAGGTDDKTFYVYWPYGTTTETYNSSAPSFKVVVTCTQK